ncbi:hypothetical protein V6N13_005188 [Hibiscus sabdariffa]|uniref:Pentatricopeptide repeat-containing protein n=1 Tax=Hibiscus sabdariffa TaxID=183260 RepID=A0ABR2ERB6_9ROSI
MLHECIMKFGIDIDIVVGTTLLDMNILLFYANLLGSFCASRFYFFTFIHDNRVVNLLSYGRYFESMKDYGIGTNIEHYCCVVDLFGRVGRLAEAENFILTPGFKNNPIMWRTLLSVCRVYK